MDKSSPFQSVAILAPGLIGGSIGLALHKNEPSVSIHVWARREQALEPIKQSGLAMQCTTNISEAVKNCDLIILCSPIGVMAEITKTFHDLLKPDAVVTDVGSVKGKVEADLAPLFQGKARWCGSHPMTGSEKTGFKAARADLFHGATTILTPTAATSLQTVQSLKTFWELLGSHVLELSPERHDSLVAQISHFPHLLASLVIHDTDQQAFDLIGDDRAALARIARPRGLDGCVQC